MDDAQTELLLTTAPFGEKSLELLQKTEFEADFSTHEAEFEADFSSDEAANAAAALLKKAEHQGRKALKLQKHETAAAAAAAAALLKKAEHQGRKAVRHEAASAKLEKMPKKKRSAALSSAEHPLPSLPPKVGAAETSANRWLESPHFTIPVHMQKWHVHKRQIRKKKKKDEQAKALRAEVAQSQHTLATAKKIMAHTADVLRHVESEHRHAKPKQVGATTGLIAEKKLLKKEVALAASEKAKRLKAQAKLHAAEATMIKMKREVAKEKQETADALRKKVEAKVAALADKRVQHVMEGRVTPKHSIRRELADGIKMAKTEEAADKKYAERHRENKATTEKVVHQDELRHDERAKKVKEIKKTQKVLTETKKSLASTAKVVHHDELRRDAQQAKKVLEKAYMSKVERLRMKVRKDVADSAAHRQAYQAHVAHNAKRLGKVAKTKKILTKTRKVLHRGLAKVAATKKILTETRKVLQKTAVAIKKDAAVNERAKSATPVVERPIHVLAKPKPFPQKPHAVFKGHEEKKAPKVVKTLSRDVSKKRTSKPAGQNTLVPRPGETATKDKAERAKKGVASKVVKEKPDQVVTKKMAKRRSRKKAPEKVASLPEAAQKVEKGTKKNHKLGLSSKKEDSIWADVLKKNKIAERKFVAVLKKNKIAEREGGKAVKKALEKATPRVVTKDAQAKKDAQAQKPHAEVKVETDLKETEKAKETNKAKNIAHKAILHADKKIAAKDAVKIAQHAKKVKEIKKTQKVLTETKKSLASTAKVLDKTNHNGGAQKKWAEKKRAPDRKSVHSQHILTTTKKMMAHTAKSIRHSQKFKNRPPAHLRAYCSTCRACFSPQRHPAIATTKLPKALVKPHTNVFTKPAAPIPPATRRMKKTPQMVKAKSTRREKKPNKKNPHCETIYYPGRVITPQSSFLYTLLLEEGQGSQGSEEHMLGAKVSELLADVGSITVTVATHFSTKRCYVQYMDEAGHKGAVFLPTGAAANAKKKKVHAVRAAKVFAATKKVMASTMKTHQSDAQLRRDDDAAIRDKAAQRSVWAKVTRAEVAHDIPPQDDQLKTALQAPKRSSRRLLALPQQEEELEAAVHAATRMSGIHLQIKDANKANLPGGKHHTVVALATTEQIEPKPKASPVPALHFVKAAISLDGAAARFGTKRSVAAFKHAVASAASYYGHSGSNPLIPDLHYKMPRYSSSNVRVVSVSKDAEVSLVTFRVDAPSAVLATRAAVQFNKYMQKAAHVADFCQRLKGEGGLKNLRSVYVRSAAAVVGAVAAVTPVAPHAVVPSAAVGVSADTHQSFNVHSTPLSSPRTPGGVGDEAHTNKGAPKKRLQALGRFCSMCMPRCPGANPGDWDA
jgi:hypothetical protein